MLRKFVMNHWYKEKSYEDLKTDDYAKQEKNEIQHRSEKLIQPHKEHDQDKYTITQVLKWRNYYYILFHGEYPSNKTNYLRLLEKDFWDDDFINKESVFYLGYNGNENIAIIENEHLSECTVVADFGTKY